MTLVKARAERIVRMRLPDELVGLNCSYDRKIIQKEAAYRNLGGALFCSKNCARGHELGLLRKIMPEWRDGQPGCAGRHRGKLCLKELAQGSVVYQNPGHLIFCSVECARTRKD